MLPPDPRKGSLFVSALVHLTFLPGVWRKITSVSALTNGGMRLCARGPEQSPLGVQIPVLCPSVGSVSDSWRHQPPMHYTSTPGDALFTG